MSKHDSKVFLVIHSPFQPILAGFIDGFPVRDPFPTAFVDGNPYWVIDLHRCTRHHLALLSTVYGKAEGWSTQKTCETIDQFDSMLIADQWVDILECGPEGRARLAEYREFLAWHPDPSEAELRAFFADQKLRWILGDAVPEPELMISSFLADSF